MEDCHSQQNLKVAFFAPGNSHITKTPCQFSGIAVPEMPQLV
jgi:hypothetical protein